MLCSNLPKVDDANHNKKPSELAVVIAHNSSSCKDFKNFSAIFKS